MLSQFLDVYSLGLAAQMAPSPPKAGAFRSVLWFFFGGTDRDNDGENEGKHGEQDGTWMNMMEYRSMCGNIMEHMEIIDRKRWLAYIFTDGKHRTSAFVHGKRWFDMSLLVLVCRTTGEILKENLQKNYAVLHGDLIKMSEIGFLQGKITYDILTAFSHPSPTSLEIWSISMLSILSGNYNQY